MLPLCRRWFRRWPAVLAALLAVVGLVAGNVPAASAHALLVRSDPAAGDTLSASPNGISLWFSEPVEVEPGWVTVTDASGNRQDLGNARVARDDVQQVTVNIKTLNQGAYTVRWRVVSVDTHVVAGAFQFGVGVQVPGGGGAEQPAGSASLIEAALRWGALLGFAVLAGGFWFRLLVLAPVVTGQPALARAEAGLLRTVRWATLAVLVINLLWLWFQVVQVADGNLLAIIQPESLAKVVLRSRFGMVWLARMMCVMATLGVIDQLAVLIAQPGGKGLRWWQGGALLSLALIATGSVLGHAASREPVALTLTVDWLHVTAMSLWIGGLFHLVLITVSAGFRAQPGARLGALNALLPGFSRLAVVSVQVLIASGLLVAWIQMGRTEAFVTTDYGRTLLIKLAISVPLLLVGAVNLLRFGPQVERAAVGEGLKRPALERLLGGLTTSLRGEAVLGIAVLATAGLLASTPTPYLGATSGAAAGATKVATQPAGVTIAQGGTSTLVAMHLAPAALGSNTVTVNVRDASGVDVPGAAVQVAVTAEGASGSSVVVLEPRDGAYRGITQLPTAGVWNFEVRVQAQGKPQETAPFTLRLPLPGAQARLVAVQEAMNKLTALKERQVLRGGSAASVTYDYRYNAPGSVSGAASDGSDVVIIGSTRYNKAGSQWNMIEGPSDLAYRFPDYQFTLGAEHVTDLGAEVVDGVPTTILAYDQPGTGYYYRLWVDDANLVRRIKMVGPSHFMDAQLSDFNVPNTITPPQ